MDASKIKTLIDLFRARAAESADSAAMLVKRDGAFQPILWRDVAREVRRVAAGLLSLGVKPGDRVAILSENRPEWAYADMATLAAGAIDVPIYATNLAKQCEYILKDSGAVACFVSSAQQLGKVLDCLGACPDLRTVIAFDPVPEELRRRSVVELPPLARMGDQQLVKTPAALDERAASAREDDPCSFIYTSGTTGDPKGVVLTHKNFVSNAKAVASVTDFGTSDLYLSFLPLSHSFERMGGYYLPILVGSTIAYAESIDKVRDNLKEVRPTVMCSVPRLYEKMYAGIQEKAEKSSPRARKIFRWALGVGAQRSEVVRSGRSPGPWLWLKNAIADALVFTKIRETLGGRLRFFVSGGAPLARDIAVFFHSVGVTILEGYGLSETSPVITVNTGTNLRLGTVGKVIPEVEVKFAPDGEILVRGPNVMKGYFRNEAATREVFDEEGFFRTGDIGERDADGFIRITDRKKDLMKTSGGKYIAPQVIENLFKTDRLLAECVVIADNRNYATALLVPKFDALEAFARDRGLAFASRAELLASREVLAEIGGRIDAFNRDLPQYEKIKKWRLLDRELSQEQGELTPTLKVKRKVVNQRWKDLIDGMYAEGREEKAHA